MDEGKALLRSQTKARMRRRRSFLMTNFEVAVIFQAHTRTRARDSRYALNAASSYFSCYP